MMDPLLVWPACGTLLRRTEVVKLNETICLDVSDLTSWPGHGDRL